MKSSITVTEAALILSRYRELCSAKNDLDLSRTLHERFAVMAFVMSSLAVVVSTASHRHWTVSVGFCLLFFTFTGYAGWQACRFSRIRRLFEAYAPQNLADVGPSNAPNKTDAGNG